MEFMKLGRWNIEVDKIRTKEFYSNHHEITEYCDCQDCRNYVSVCNKYSQEVKQFFKCFGIDPIKEAEVYVCARNSDGSLLYGGFYHVVGNLINGEDFWIRTDKTSNYAEPYKLNNEFSYGFTEENALVPDGFPEPVLQLEFITSLPWGLDEKCEY